MNGQVLLLDSHRGIYIPQNFAEMFNYWQGISKEDKDILLYGPEHQDYWNVWDDVLCMAFYVDENENTWELHQDQDLWAVCTALMSEVEYSEFFER